MGWTPQQLVLPMLNVDLMLYMVPRAHLSLPSSWHLDRFSYFLGLTNVTNRQTDTQTMTHHL